MFSVLLSLYQKEHPSHLRQSLNSLFSQTLLPDEIILVKDGPLTAELDTIVSDYATRHPILKVIPLPKNQGLGKALNEGLKHCSFELVARMDTDDIAKPDRFEKQVKVFEEHPELDLVGAWIDEFEGTSQHVLSVRKVPETLEGVLPEAVSGESSGGDVPQKRGASGRRLSAFSLVRGLLSVGAYVEEWCQVLQHPGESVVFPDQPGYVQAPRWMEVCHG